MNTKRKTGIMLVGILLFACIATVTIKLSQFEDKTIPTKIDEEIKKLTEIPAHYSLEQILKNSFADVDVTNTVDTEIKKISLFLNRFEDKQPAILKTIRKVEIGDLNSNEEDYLIILYRYDSSFSSQIRVDRYLVKQQKIITFDERYKNLFTESGNGVTTAYLIPSGYDSLGRKINLENDIIYSYFESSPNKR